VIIGMYCYWLQYGQSSQYFVFSSLKRWKDLYIDVAVVTMISLRAFCVLVSQAVVVDDDDGDDSLAHSDSDEKMIDSDSSSDNEEKKE
jgi:hypothetical protein